MVVHEIIVRVEYPECQLVQRDDWFYIQKNKNLPLNVMNVAGQGRSPEGAWKSAARKVNENNRTK